MKKLISLIIIMLPFLLYSQEATYRNPVIAGDCPDPTVIRVGDSYYVAGTSSEWMPPYRLYESKDLVNWTYLGSLFKDKPLWTVGSYWAPELFYRNGIFYAYYTARRKSDLKSFIGVATTRDIRQGFTDHGLIVEWTNEAIDAFVNEFNGSLYITWKAYGLDHGKNVEILGSELTDDGLNLKGEVFSLIEADSEGWEAGGAEGQCLLRHGDYIYMFYSGNACCGANCNYQTGVARATTMQGPWEKYAANPILHSGGQWRCPGHGTVVTTPDGRYFYLYHAYNAATNVFTGRQGLIDEIVWDAATGWPSFRYGTIPSIQAAAPYTETVQQNIQDFSDKFDATELKCEWLWDASNDKPNYQIKDGKLILAGNSAPAGTILALRPRRENYGLQATIDKGSSNAGISIYGSKDHATGLSLVGDRLELWQVKEGVRLVLVTDEIPKTKEITLFMETRFGQYCRFGFIRQDGSQQQTGTLLHITNLPLWDRPPMIGIHAGKEGETGIFTEVTIKYSSQH